VNGGFVCTSARIQGVRRRSDIDDGANPRPHKNKTETTMLRTLSAAVVAASLIAAPAIAAQPGDTGSAPATTAPASTPNQPVAATPAKTNKPVHHRHLVRHKTHKIKVARHLKTNKKRVVAHNGKPVKTTKTTKVSKVKKTGKPSKTSKTGKPNKPATSNQG
jgi:hypothetical protein